jgi:hypothetical protein
MKSFEVKGKVWRYPGEAAWYFVYVPQKPSQQIKDTARNKKKVGFHFVKVKATIGKTTWNTSLFPTKDGPYLIAIKADVRHKEGIDEGDAVKINCSLL